MKLNKILKLFLAIFIAVVLINPMKVSAASVSVTASSQTVYVGDTVTFTVSVSNGAGYLNISGAVTDTNSWFENQSKTYTVKASQIGTMTVYVDGVIADFTTEEDQTISRNTTYYTVTVIQRPSSNSGGGSNSGSSSSGSGSSTTTPVTDNRSSNNNLSSLSISEGELSPAFSSDVTEYSVELASSVTSITVNASASDAKASVSGTGEISLNAGDNRIEITVTAENGNPKLYVINAYVDEAPLVFVSYGDKELGVVRNLNGVTLEGFEETSVQIDGNEVKAWHSPTRNITVVYLEKDDEKNFYIYDETEGITSVYKQVAILGNTLGIVDIPEDLQEKAGMTYQEITIDDVTLMGWVYEDKAFSNYSLIYAMNDMGEYQYYQYESTQNTLQLYSGAAAVTQEDYENLVNHSESMQLYFYIALGGCVVLLAASVYGFVCASRYKKRLISKGNELNDIIKAD